MVYNNVYTAFDRHGYPRNLNHNTDHSSRSCTLLIGFLFKLAKFRQAFLILYYVYALVLVCTRVCVCIHIFEALLLKLTKVVPAQPQSVMY